MTVPPERLVDIAKQQNSLGVAFTYTEPLIGYEYIIDTAEIARAEGLKIVLVTNGYINHKPLEKLLNYVDAMNIDLKSMDPEFYRQLCKGRVEPVLDTIKSAHDRGILLEVTYLVITTINDKDEDFSRIVDFISGVDRAIPFHISRYFPAYKFKLPPTPVATMLKAYQVARERLDYVYLGNIAMRGYEDTYCPGCGNVLVERNIYAVSVVGIEGNRCNRCGREVDIIQASSK